MKKTGFTLMELSLSMLIFVVALIALLGAFIFSFSLVETSKNLTIALNAAQAELEKVKKTEFDLISSYQIPLYAIDPLDPLPSFLSDLPKEPEISDDPIGWVYVSQFGLSSDIKKVKVAVAWKQGNRWIGLDSNDDGELDSPCELVTLISKR